MFFGKNLIHEMDETEDAHASRVDESKVHTRRRRVDGPKVRAHRVDGPKVRTHRMDEPKVRTQRMDELPMFAS